MNKMVTDGPCLATHLQYLIIIIRLLLKGLDLSYLKMKWKRSHIPHHIDSFVSKQPQINCKKEIFQCSSSCSFTLISSF